MSHGNSTQENNDWICVGTASSKSRKVSNNFNPNFDRVVRETKDYSDIQEHSDKILIKNLQEKTKTLEEQIKQFENRIKILEDQMKNLQCASSTVNDAKQNTSNKSDEISADNSKLPKSKIDDATSMQQAHLKKSKEPTKKKCKTSTGKPDPMFNRWMNSREPNKSLWSDTNFCGALLSYIGSKYGQKGKIRRVLESLKIHSNSSDELDQLYKIIERLEQQPGATESLNTWRGKRSSHRLDELEIIFEYDTMPLSILNQWKIEVAPDVKKIIDPNTIKAYFDLISRDGSITAEIGQYLKLKKANIFGGDDDDIHNNDVTFVKINFAQSTIDLTDNSVDLITCLVTLHHVHDLNLIFHELTRILKPGGYLILREHDCKNEYSLPMKYLNFVHAFMMIARIGEFSHLPELKKSADWTRLKAEIVNYTSSIQYHARDEWRHMLENVGFQWKATIDYPPGRNPQALYYSVFQFN